MLVRNTLAHGVVVYQAPRLLELGVPHAFSTRLGGVSPTPFDTMNLGNPADMDCQDSPENIAANYRRLLAALDMPVATRAWVRQVHGCDIAVLPAAMAAMPREAAVVADFQGGLAADALIADESTAVLSIRIADCVPILLSAADGRLVAAIHAGWRGIVAGVVQQTVIRLGQMGVKPAEIVAAIGPAIGRDFFTVNSEVRLAFMRVDLGRAIIQHPAQQDRVDLNLAVRIQLARMGVSQIDFGDLCTFRDAADFFSHRRDCGRTGRMAALIQARPA